VGAAPPVPALSEFYVRKRRLAYVFGALSLALLVAQIQLSFVLETYDAPRASALPEGWAVIHGVRPAEGEGPAARLMILDPSLGLLRTLPLFGEATGVLAEGDEVTVFFGTRYSVLRGGDAVRGADLGQAWPVMDAVRDPARGQAWIFGAWERAVVGRRRHLGRFSEEIRVAEAGPVERLTASVDGDRGPLVAWRERGSSAVKAFLFDGASFAPRAEFVVGDAEHWDAVLDGDRVLLFSYRREDRTFREVALRVACCPGCGRPAPPERIAFADSVLLLGKRVTGLAAAIGPAEVLLVLARPTTAQAASIPRETLRPAPGARLRPLGAEPLGLRMAAAFWPVTMLFFSFSLIFLGFTLLRERSRFILERLRPVAREGPAPAEILQRAMAHVLDQMALYPAVWVVAEALNAVPDTAALDLGDPKTLGLAGVWFGLRVAYHALFEGAFGWTIGKKIIGLKVVREDGSRAGFGRALVRNLARPLDAEYPLGVFLGASFLMATRRRQRPGDLWARTLVVQDLREGPSPRGLSSPRAR
jgi:uncharacterized RDD family membrane protein YckC